MPIYQKKIITIGLFLLPTTIYSQITNDEPNIILQASRGNIQEVNTELHKGTPVDTQDKYKRTALMTAALFACEPVVDLLLDAKCDPYLVDSGGQTVLHYVVTDTDQIDLRLSIIKKLLQQAPALINISDHGRSTPLMLMCHIFSLVEAGDIRSIVELLLAYKPRIDKKNSMHKNAIQIAHDYNNIMIRDLLQEYERATWAEREKIIAGSGNILLDSYLDREEDDKILAIVHNSSMLTDRELRSIIVSIDKLPLARAIIQKVCMKNQDNMQRLYSMQNDFSIAFREEFKSRYVSTMMLILYNLRYCAEDTNLLYNFPHELVQYLLDSLKFEAF